MCPDSVNVIYFIIIFLVTDHFNFYDEGKGVVHKGHKLGNIIYISKVLSAKVCYEPAYLQSEITLTSMKVYTSNQ